VCVPAKRDRPDPVKEAFFVRILVPDDDGGDARAEFVPATAHVGRPMPYRRPLAICALAVWEDVVALSLMHLSRRAAAKVSGSVVHMPRLLLARLRERALREQDLSPGVVVATDGTSRWRFELRRDDAGVATLEADPEDFAPKAVTLSGRPVQLSCFTGSVVGRRLALGFSGHLGKPGSVDTADRLVAMVLHSAAGLGEFRVLAGFEAVRVPPRVGRWGLPAGPGLRDRAAAHWEVGIFDLDAAPVRSGKVEVEVDLESANPATGRLLVHLRGLEGLDDGDVAAHRGAVEAAVAEVLRSAFGDELDQIVYDVVLGEVSSGTVERLRAALGSVAGVDVSPHGYRLRPAGKELR
jgi:hypothetical protein